MPIKLALFNDLPRRKRRIMMHVCDAGCVGVQFKCDRCEHTTKWLEHRTVTEDRRGRPCPVCNPEEPKE